MHRANFSAYLNDKDAIYECSKLLGYIQVRGSYKGSGSPRELLEAITAGKALVMNIADDDYAMAKELRRLAKATKPAMAELLNRVAVSIELAERLKSIAKQKSAE